VLYGDSETDTYETISLPSNCAYNAATGDLTVTSNGHQQAVGWKVCIWNRNYGYPAQNGLFNCVVSSVPDANNYVVNIGANRPLIPANDANWRYRAQSWRSSQNFVTWLQGVSDQAFNIIYSGGASGDRVDECLTRLQVDCLAYSPDTVLMLMPGVNDMSAGNTSRDLSSIIADRHTLVDRILAYGARLICLTTLPVQTGDARATLAAMSAVRFMNERLIEYCAGKPNVLVVDAYSIFVDPTSTTGLAKTSLGYLRTTDNIHQSMRGGRALAEYIWGKVKGWFPSQLGKLPTSILDSLPNSAFTLSSVTIAANGLCSATVSTSGALRAGQRAKVWGGSPAFNEYVTIASAVGTAVTFQTGNTPGSVTGTIKVSSARNLLDNPLLTTATGGALAGTATGVAASGFKVGNGTGTPGIVASVVARADGKGNDQQIVVTPTAVGDQAWIEADFNWASSTGSVNWPAQVQAGRYYVFEGELNLSGVASVGLTEIRPNLVVIVGGTTYQIYSMNGYADGPCLNSDLSAFHFKTAPMLLPAGAVTTFKFQLYLTCSLAAGSLTAKLGLVKVDEYEAAP
jgi:lysophospholipase L1-like esterase